MKPAQLGRIVLAAVLVAAIAAGLYAARAPAAAAIASAVTLSRTVQGLGMLGWLAFALVQMLVAAVGFLPASLLGVAAGALYGVASGFELSALATMAGAALSFWLSRSAFRPVVQGWISRRRNLAGLDGALAREGWRLVALVRVNPVMPFAPASFVLGLSGVGWRDYLLGTVAALPALLLYVGIGGFADAGIAAWQSGAGGLRFGLLAVGAAATAALTLRIGWLVRRAISGH